MGEKLKKVLYILPMLLLGVFLFPNMTHAVAMEGWSTINLEINVDKKVKDVKRVVPTKVEIYMACNKDEVVAVDGFKCPNMGLYGDPNTGYVTYTYNLTAPTGSGKYYTYKGTQTNTHGWSTYPWYMTVNPAVGSMSSLLDLDTDSITFINGGTAKLTISVDGSGNPTLTQAGTGSGGGTGGGGGGTGGGGSAVLKSDYILSIFSACNTVTDDSALNCWIGKVYVFAQTAIFTISLAAVIIAGILYMTSSGDPKRVTLAKSLLVGAASAIAVIVLARFFLQYVIGVPWTL
jgi:hypothetical protein